MFWRPAEMSDPIVIRVAGEPVPKGRPRIGRGPGGHPMAFTPAHTRQYENQLRYNAQLAMDGRPMLEGALRMSVVACLPVPRSWSERKRQKALAGIIHPTSRPDADNFLKIAADALNKLVFADDSQIVRMAVSKIYSTAPSLMITVSQLGEAG